MKFLKENKRFSFKLENENVWDTEYTSEITENGDELVSVYYFKGGLKVTNVAKKYKEFDAYEWVNYIENTSDKPSGIISELWDCHCTMPMPHENPRKWETYFPDKATATKIYTPEGSTWSMYDFYSNPDMLKNDTRINHIYPNVKREYTASGGRSSQDKAPFFNIHKNGFGYIMAIGWTGQWNCEIERSEDYVTLKSKIEDTYFRVMPGEKLRTSSVVIMSYEGDEAVSQNKWRRLVKKHFSLIGKDGREKHGPLSALVWGGMKSETVLERVELIKKNNLPFEYVWMDAGWYGENTLPSPDEFEGKWGNSTGDWRVSHIIHPNGLKDVSKAVHDAGMKFLLWFEPERVIRTTPIVSEHPEYFIMHDDEKVRHCLLNLGDDEAWRYCFETLSSLIEDIKIDCYRQDFNFDPLVYWRKNDTDDRKGISEIKHINGMYKLWDALLDKFPNLLIDNCSSGGRRIDIETLRRSIPLWRSDFQCPANYDIEAAQCHHMSFNKWIPYSGTGTGRAYDEYRVRSAYDANMQMHYFYSEKENFENAEKTKEKIAFVKKYTEEYLRLRPYFSEDFYPLTEFSDKSDTWCAVQFDRPSENDGIIQVFKRPNSPYGTATFSLRGIAKDSNYLFTDIDGGEFTVSGETLIKDGFKINVDEKGKAKIYLYKRI